MRALHLHLPIHPDTPGTARRQLRRWLTRRGWPDEQTDDLLIAVNEAVSNAVEHAYPGPNPTQRHHNAPDAPEVELSVSDATNDDDNGTHRLLVTVTDRGQWKLRSVSPGFRGRGLQMMRALTDSVEVTATQSGTRVAMISRAVQIRCLRTLAAVKRLGDTSTLLLLLTW